MLLGFGDQGRFAATGLFGANPVPYYYSTFGNRYYMETPGKGMFIPFCLLCINLYAFSLCWEKLNPKGQESPAENAPVDEARSLPKVVKILQWIVTFLIIVDAFTFWFWPTDKRTMSSMYFFYDDYVRNKTY